MARLILAILLASGAMFADSKVIAVNVDGVERHAVVYSPRKTAAKAPLIFVFHGAGDTAANFSGAALERAWPQAVVVYMQGLPREGSYGPGGYWQTENGQTGDRDLKFLDAALAQIRTSRPIDDARVYAMGFSNGAKFVYLLWAERPNLFAALGPVAGQHAPSLRITVPKPLIHVAGEQDHQNDIELQKGSIEMARRVNGATEKGAPCGKHCAQYAPVSDSMGAPVMTVLHPGAHVYPIETSETIVRFFKRFSGTAALP